MIRVVMHRHIITARTFDQLTLKNISRAVCTRLGEVSYLSMMRLQYEMKTNAIQYDTVTASKPAQGFDVCTTQQEKKFRAHQAQKPPI